MTIMAQKVELTDTWIRTSSRVTTGKEAIHSGHFMVSDFEAEAQDDEDELAVPVPEVAEPKAVIPCKSTLIKSRTTVNTCKFSCNQLSIETSLTKLFQCMSIAYRQKLTSPKWNRFKGVRLRWKDKIRLNNVIWRCWHMQFINKQNTLVCQFASPLDVDTHNKPEAIVLEGKYWKRKLNAVTAEYKKWRMYTHNQILGRPEKYGHDLLAEFESYEWQSQPSDSQMMVDEDYMGLMSDTLFSTITGNVPFPFPDTREIARGANLADFIQPSLVQLQPSLDEFMDIEPLHDLLCSRLATVPEEVTSPLHSLTYSTTKPTTSVAAPPTSASSTDSRLDQSYQHQQQQTGGSYPPLWYIPPYNQEATAPQPQPPPPPPPYRSPPVPPPPPPPRKEEAAYAVAKLANKPKLKHVSRSLPGGNKKLISTNSAPSLLQTEMPVQTLQASASTSHQQQQKQQQQKQQQRQQRNNSSSALLEQLLTTSSSGSLFSFMANEPSSQPKLGSSPTQRSQCVDVSFLPGQFDQLDNQLLYQNAPSDILNKTSSGYGLSQDQSSPLAQPKTEAVSPPRCAYVMSPIHQPPVPPLNASGGSPESPSQEQLSLSPLSMGSPTSPSGKFIPGYKEHRRVCHINAEQKRRCNIKNGFDTLHSLIPQLNQNPNAKMSKAAMLQKGADYIVQLRNERNSLKQEMESLRQQIDALNSAICNCQSMLPVTGAPISRHRSNKMRDMFRQYIRVRTSENWKFWILSLICEPLLESFNNNVSTNSLEELYQTTLQWIDQHCTLVDLRPVVLNALRYLCTTTEVLSDPARLPIEARAAVEKSPKKPNS